MSAASAGRADRFGRRIAAARDGRQELAEAVAYLRAVMAAVSRVSADDATWADDQCHGLARQLTDLAIKADTRTAR